MADTATVGILKTMLTMDTSSYSAGAKKAASDTASVKKSVSGLKEEVQKLTPQAERMVRAFGGDKLLHTANNLTAAVTKLGGASKLTANEHAKINSTLTAAIAKYTALGQTAPKAMVDLEKATRSTSGPLNSLNSQLKSSIGLTAGLGAAIGTFAAQLAGQAIRGLIMMGREAFTTASSLIDMAAKTGLTTDTLQRLDAVGGQAGVTLDAFASAAFKLGNRLAGGGDSVQAAVKALHLDLDKLMNMSPDQRLFAVLTALSTHVDRNKLGVELFGKSFEQISAAVVANFGDIAKAAKASTDAQLQALDVAGDRWDLFVKNAKAGIRSLLGDIILAGDELKKTSLLNLLGTALVVGVPNVGGVLALRAGKKATEDAKRTAEEQAKARGAQVKAEADYVTQLKAVQAELAKLTPAQRKQIDAAKELGGDALSKLEDQYGLTDGALRLYGASLKSATTSSKGLSQAQRDLARDAEHLRAIADGLFGRDVIQKANDYVTALGGVGNLSKLSAEKQRELHTLVVEAIEAYVRLGQAVPPILVQIAQQTATIATTTTDWVMALSQLPSTLLKAATGMDALYASSKRMADVQETLAKGGFITPTITIENQNASLDVAADREAEILERRKQNWERFTQTVQQLFSPLLGGVDNGIQSLLFGSGQDNGAKQAAKDAREEYDRLKASGKSSAEDITRAFRAMRDAEEQANRAFGGRWHAFWQSLVRGVKDTLANLLSYFVNSFLKGIIQSLAGTGLGKAFGGFLSKLLGFGGGGAFDSGGGLLGSVPGLLGLGGGATLASTSAVPTTAALLGAAPTVAGSSTAAAGGTAAAGTGIGLGAATGIGAVVAGAVWALASPSSRINPELARYIRERTANRENDPHYDWRKVPAEFNVWKSAHPDQYKAWLMNPAMTAPIPTPGEMAPRKFNQGGFVPPNVTMPAILHGGSMGELVVPLNKLAQQSNAAPTVVHNHTWNVSTWDTADWRRNFKDKILPAFKFSVITDSATRSTVREAALT